MFEINPEVKVTEEYGYLLGVMCSDGYLNFESRCMALRMNSLGIVTQCRDIANKLLAKDIQIHQYEKAFHINVCDVDFLRAHANLKTSPEQYLHTSADWMGFWKGFWDGDGGISLPKKAESIATEARIFLSIGDRTFAEKLHALMSSTHSTSRVFVQRDVLGSWCTIYLKILDLPRFASTIGFREESKAKRLELVVAERLRKGLIV